MTPQSSDSGAPQKPAPQTTVEEAVRQTAWEHLRAGDADAALSHYEPDALVASDGVLSPSFDAFARQAREFYRTLQEVHLAVWDDMHVEVLSDQLAVLTATFRWSSTDTAGVRTDLKGVWTGVFVRRQGQWRIRMRHESTVRAATA